MTRVFVDTNIVLDLLAKRSAYRAAARLFVLGDKGSVALFVSALTFANAHYILAKQHDRTLAIKVLRDLSLAVTIVDLSGKVVQLALNDENFSDFEDGLQYHSALENGMDVIVTRNQKDFRHSILPVLTAEQYLSSVE